MTKRIFALAILSMVLGVVTANAQSASAAQGSAAQTRLTRYESFLKRADNTVIVTQSYPVGQPAAGWRISGNVAWALGETNKVYAADIYGRIVDFEQLKSMQEGLDKLIQAIKGSYDKLNAASMNYASPAGLSVSYYTFTGDNGTPTKSLYITIGSYAMPFRDANLDPLVKLRDEIAQTRAKLISLGAK